MWNNISIALCSKRQIILNVVSSEIVSVCFEALDKSLKDIASETNHGYGTFFFGKVIVFDGDFKQI